MILCPFLFVVVLGDIGTIHWSQDPVHGGDGPQNALWPGTPWDPCGVPTTEAAPKRETEKMKDWGRSIFGIFS